MGRKVIKLGKEEKAYKKRSYAFPKVSRNFWILKSAIENKKVSLEHAEVI